MRSPRITAGSDNRWKPRFHLGYRGAISTSSGLGEWLPYEDYMREAYDMLVKFFPCRVYINSNR
jgi:hypothetical protein